MNLIINALAARWGGAQTYLINLLKYTDSFPEIKIYLLANSSFVDHNDFKGVKIIKPNFSSKNIIYRFFWQRWYLPKLLKKLKADMLFCPGGTENISRSITCPVVVSFRNMLIFDVQNRRKYPLGYMRCRLAFLEKMSRKVFKRANLVIFISEYAKKVIDEKVSDRKGLSIVIPHAVNDEFRTAQRDDIPRLELLPSGDYLLYASLIEAYKAQIEVVRAYHLLCQKRHTNEKLLLVGPEHTSYGDNLRKEISRFGLEDKIIITGKIPYTDMPSLYQNAKAHIFASTCENCPNIVLESLASGRPLFVSNKPPMPEFTGEAAVYFDPYKPEELCDLLLRYLDDSQWMKMMGQKALEQSRLYSWEMTATKTFRAMLNLKAGDLV